MARQHYRRLVLDGCEHGDMLISAGVKVLFEVDRLMLVSGVGASPRRATCKGRQPFDRGHLHHRPGRDRRRRRVRGPDWVGSERAWLLTPIELGSVAPDTVQNDGHLSGDGNLRLLEANALDEAQAPGLQRRPSLGAMDERFKACALCGLVAALWEGHRHV
jgi:hypothetical protein